MTHIGGRSTFSPRAARRSRSLWRGSKLWSMLEVGLGWRTQVYGFNNVVAYCQLGWKISCVSTSVGECGCKSPFVGLRHYERFNWLLQLNGPPGSFIPVGKSPPTKSIHTNRGRS